MCFNVCVKCLYNMCLQHYNKDFHVFSGFNLLMLADLNSFPLCVNICCQTGYDYFVSTSEDHIQSSNHPLAHSSACLLHVHVILFFAITPDRDYSFFIMSIPVCSYFFRSLMKVDKSLVMLKTIIRIKSCL